MAEDSLATLRSQTFNQGTIRGNGLLESVLAFGLTGVIEPGNSIGELTIDGQIHLGEGTYAGEIDGTQGSADLVAITGEPQLASGSLLITWLSPPVHQAGQCWPRVAGNRLYRRCRHQPGNQGIYLQGQGAAARREFLPAAQQDFAGGIHYSEVVYVTFPGSTALVLYPNPASTTMQVLSERTGAYQIFNLAGQLLQQGQLGEEIKVALLPPGVYVLRTAGESARFTKI